MSHSASPRNRSSRRSRSPGLGSDITLPSTGRNELIHNGVNRFTGGPNGQSPKAPYGSAQYDDSMRSSLARRLIRANKLDCQQPVAPPFRRFVDEDAMYQAVTRNIAVTVSPRFLPERSSTAESRYFWAYTIEISNRSD